MFRCDHAGCAKVCDTRKALRYHKHFHRERRLKSSQCSKSFHFPRDLERHEETHKETRTWFPCEVEGCKPRRGSAPGFARKDHLKRHMETCHSGLMDSQAVAQDQSSSIDPQADDEETMVDDPTQSDTTTLATLQPPTSGNDMLRDRQQWNRGCSIPDPSQSSRRRDDTNSSLYDAVSLMAVVETPVGPNEGKRRKNDTGTTEAVGHFAKSKRSGSGRRGGTS